MNNQRLIQLFYLLILFNYCNTIWPRPYKIDLSEENTFELSEEITSDDENDIFDPNDEMIKSTELEHFNINKDDDKYYRIHQLAMRRNKKSNNVDLKNVVHKHYKLNETNIYDDLDYEPFFGVYVNQNGTRIDSDEISKRMAMNYTKEKRQNPDDDYDINYDYARFKAEYDAQEEKVQFAKNTYNYTDIKEEESVDDAVQTIIKLDKPKNCTAEELKGIGISAARCFFSDLQGKESAKQHKVLMKRIIKYLLIWLTVYIFIAIPCWCQNGWCCCCCICPMCYPKARIDEVKKFIVDNPIGVYHENGVRMEYKATPYEKYTQKKLEKQIMRL